MVVVRMGGVQWKTIAKGNTDDQFAINNISQMRSNIRRLCKLGNELEFMGNYFINEPRDINDARSTKSNGNNNARDWNTWQKFIVDYDLQSSQSNIKVFQVGKWDATLCQRMQSKFFERHQRKQPSPTKKHRRENDSFINNSFGNDSQLQQHQQHASAKGKQKRIQGEVLAAFLLWMLSTIYNNDDNHNDSNVDQSLIESASSNNDNNNEWIREEMRLRKLPADQNYLFYDRWKALHPSLMVTSSHDDSLFTQARYEMVAEKLRKGITTSQSSRSSSSSNNNSSDSYQHVTSSQLFRLGGILDAAGGAGHVSLALSLRGIQSTVVDPRPTIGKLPGRDRKVLKKSKSKVQFSTYRAWFGKKPNGVDTVYREGRSSTPLETFLPESERGVGLDDLQHELPICSMSSNDKLLPNCAAIVALHPDEATGVIVQTAVENKIPFVVVPCCVFSRLFPERTKPGGRGGGVVSTYYELIDWLVDLHPAIRVTTLPFEGANLAVWATFH